MPIEVRILDAKPDQTVEFKFGGPVQDSAVGIAYWKFGYNNDNHVRTIELSVSTNKSGDSIVTAMVIAKLHDDSGHHIDPSVSTVKLCCIAVVGPKNPAIALDNANNIANGEQSTRFTLPSSSCAIGTTFLSGWKLSYNDDHQLATMQLGTGISVHGNEAAITAVASMRDNSNNHASTAQVNGGLVAAISTGDGLLQTTGLNLQMDGEYRADFNQPIQDTAAVFIQSYQVTFHKSQDNHVRTIGGGCSSWTAGGSTVWLKAPKAFVTDDSGNVQTNDSSKVTFVIIAIPKP
ncbi:hypothetical protein MYSTI_01872 [Myxococcus stipitatus DSM 14675]|uniref:Uncharacterized protein n=1 Tax=Myxococcus stipitatus (strain DSM 14675 / JCM 12634 / Mx s8) TaxID=1278073 RepID=L7U9R0_MYXSD|nr:hypothetical protein [Myxococcus stipitatus]AGC43204.1 hypothetical protein MYSTI_01872 [Myxococcus stipitatus DSM 14675]